MSKGIDAVKRKGNLFDQIVDYNNLYDAFKKSKREKMHRTEIQRYYLDIGENIYNLRKSMIMETYRPGKYRVHHVFVPKFREIKALPFNDRVLQHAVNNIIEPIFEKSFIEHSYACRRGKGTHIASYHLQRWLYINHIQGNKLYTLKCDVRKYFDSIDIEILYNIIHKKIKDKKLLRLISVILHRGVIQKGIPIGNLTSQLFANVYLNELDHYIKEVKQIKYYMRYMDDFVILGENKEELWKLLKDIESFLANHLNLKLNDKTRIYLTSSGVDFVGYVHFYNKIRIRKSTFIRFKKNLKLKLFLHKKNTLSDDRLRSTASSCIGALMHANLKHTCRIIQRRIYERGINFKIKNLD